MKMEKEIKEIIEKNLPAQVGDVLKQRLEQAEKDATTVKRLEEALQERNTTIVLMEKRLVEYAKFDERNATLEKREEAAKEVERNNKIKELEYQLASEQAKTTFVKEVSLGLVRNTEFRKSVFDTESQGAYTDASGRYVQPSSISRNSTETQTNA